MNAQIFQIRFGDHRTYRIWHTADAELETGAVRDFFYDQLRDCLIDVRGSGSAAHFGDGRVIPLYDHVNFGNVDAVFLAAQASRHIFIDFYDNDLGALAAGAQMGCARAEIEVTVGIHR